MKSYWKSQKTILSLWQPSLPGTLDSWWSSLPPEFRLLLACLRLAPSEPEILQIASLSRSGIAWPSLMSLVDRHRTAPLVYQNLRRYGNNVPESVMILLRSRLENNTRRSLANAAELVRLYKLFQEHHIPCIPLKGSVLASQVYGNLALRHAGDIDLLVASRHLELADHLLQTDYRRVLPNFPLTASQHQRFTRVMNHFEYWHKQGNLRLELHWRPIQDKSPAALDLSQLSDGASAVILGGSTLPALSLRDNVLYLCGHGWHHFWYNLFWLVDLAEIIRQNSAIDWPQLITWASAVGLLPQLVLGVALAHKLLDAPLPEAIRIRAWRDPLVSYSAQISCCHLLCPDPADRPVPLRLHSFACRIRAANSLAEKLIILQELFLGLDWMTMSLPDSLFFLHFLLRHPLWMQRKLRRRRNERGQGILY
jgi:hypothetical protein